MFKRRPRRDYVSPFEPEGSHGGCPTGDRMGRPRTVRNDPRGLNKPTRSPKTAGLASAARRASFSALKGDRE